MLSIAFRYLVLDLGLFNYYLTCELGPCELRLVPKLGCLNHKIRKP